jgi:hypothetical protein
MPPTAQNAMNPHHLMHQQQGQGAPSNLAAYSTTQTQDAESYMRYQQQQHHQLRALQAQEMAMSAHFAVETRVLLVADPQYAQQMAMRQQLERSQNARTFPPMQTAIPQRPKTLGEMSQIPQNHRYGVNPNMLHNSGAGYMHAESEASSNARALQEAQARMIYQQQRADEVNRQQLLLQEQQRQRYQLQQAQKTEAKPQVPSPMKIKTSPTRPVHAATAAIPSTQEVAPDRPSKTVDTLSKESLHDLNRPLESGEYVARSMGGSYGGVDLELLDQLVENSRLKRPKKHRFTKHDLSMSLVF